MAGLGDMFGASFAAVNGQKPRNSDRIQAGQPLNLRGAFEAATNIPVVGDALSGGMAMYDAAKGDYPSAAMNALGVLPFVSGTFIGKGAKTWDAIKAADAEKRIAAGDDARKVWKETGTFKGPDGHLRQEIDDSSAFLNFNPEYFGKKSASGKTSQLYEHPELYKAYPDSADTITRMRFDAGNKGGSYGPEGIAVNVSNPLDSEDVLPHELQHAIQDREGFAQGGNLEMFNPKQAERARDVVSWRNQVEQWMGKNWPNARMDTETLRNADQRLRDEYGALGAYEWVPPVELRDEALQYTFKKGSDKRSELEQMVKEYGLDKRTSAPSQMNMYRRLAGEAEARATQARMNMNMEQRLNTYPLDSYDVPVDQLIIRGNTPIGAAFGGK